MEDNKSSDEHEVANPHIRHRYQILNVDKWGTKECGGLGQKSVGGEEEEEKEKRREKRAR